LNPDDVGESDLSDMTASAAGKNAARARAVASQPSTTMSVPKKSLQCGKKNDARLRCASFLLTENNVA
jgi:hypothetical protein